MRAGLARLSEDSFDKDGQRITFQRLTLTPDGQRTRVLAPDVVMLPAPPEPAKSSRSAASVAPRRDEALGEAPARCRVGALLEACLRACLRARHRVG